LFQEFFHTLTVVCLFFDSRDRGRTLFKFCPLSIPDYEIPLAMPVPARIFVKTPANPQIHRRAGDSGVNFSRGLRELHAMTAKLFAATGRKNQTAFNRSHAVENTPRAATSSSLVSGPLNGVAI
jgi:hypothetical protein